MDERLPSQSRGMWKRFSIAGLLIVLLAGSATATVAENTVGSLKNRLFPEGHRIHVSPHIVEETEYSGGPVTFLVLGSDRREKSADVYDRSDPPHSDTILLVRFDPVQGQTSVLSIPRDLLVNVKSRRGAYYPQEKINAAYTYGAKEGGTKGSMELAAETIEKEVFPGLQINGIVDVNFGGFIKVVDTLGCVYVNVDHRYLHVNGEGGEVPAAPAIREPLTPRENEVLRLVTEGCSNKQGGVRMQISYRTFESHRAEVMRKLGARNGADLVRMTLSENTVTS